MAEAEAFFRGSPGDFSAAVGVYDRQLAERHGHRRGVMIYNTAPAAPGAAKAVVVISELSLAEAASRGGSWDGSLGECEAWQWTATITAYALPGGRSRLWLRSEEACWPVVAEHWRGLRAELARLGYIESDGAGPPAAADPGQKPKRGGGKRSDYTDAERREACEQYRRLGGGMTQDEFMEERYRMSGRALRDWLLEFGL